jgi:V8-like Glu-specific endopeptidase
MARRGAFILIAMVAVAAATTPAGAVLNGTSSHSLSAYTVRVVGNGTCSGVVIARRLVATARHCAYGMSVLAERRYYRVSKVSRSGTLDDGRHVKATGDSSFLHLAKPLPETVAAVPVADDGKAEDLGETYIIAGYGGGRLRQANLVAESEYALVDPTRKGIISASACFGDSGGPVIRGGWLVGVITRAAHPHPSRACGHLTRWAPISITTEAEPDAKEVKTAKGTAAMPSTKRKRASSRRVHAKRNASAGWLGWFTPQAKRAHRTARR